MASSLFENIVLRDLTKLVKIIQAMMEVGFTKVEIKKVWSGNFLHVMEQNIDRKIVN